MPAPTSTEFAQDMKIALMALPEELCSECRETWVKRRDDSRAYHNLLSTTQDSFTIVVSEEGSLGLSPEDVANAIKAATEAGVKVLMDAHSKLAVTEEKEYVPGNDLEDRIDKKWRSLSDRQRGSFDRIARTLREEGLEHAQDFYIEYSRGDFKYTRGCHVFRDMLLLRAFGHQINSDNIRNLLENHVIYELSKDDPDEGPKSR